jgi:carboxypeptidase family protein/TonB-dependent receptor-like protein
MRCPRVIAGDPAPQQLTAPCRKYTGRLRHPLEQGAYLLISQGFPEIGASPQRHNLSLRSQFCSQLFCAVLVAFVPFQAAALRGRVVDARTSVGLERVLVVVQDAGRSVLTDKDGRFAVEGLSTGPHRIYVSVVGYAVEERLVVLDGTTPVDVVVPLTEGTGGYAESVTVTPDVFRAPPVPVASSQVLGAAELQNLRGVLADDPLRAVQMLPGVATGDDLRSEFTIRGSDFHHITFTVDGFATPYLLHTVRGVDDRGGSIAMINSDVLEDVALLNGGYAQRYGGHTGAELDFRLREGSRERRALRLDISGTGASAIVEGPLGRERKGSWLVAGRQSYLDLIVHHLTSRSVSFGFSDAQARLVYDVTPRQHVELTVLAGRSRFEEAPQEIGIADLAVGTNASFVTVAGWRTTFGKTVLTQRVLTAFNHFHNLNDTSVELDRGSDRQYAYRADATIVPVKTLQVEAGASVERLEDERLRRRLVAFPQTFGVIDDYTGHGTRAGAYALVRWSPLESVTIAPGVRADRWTLTEQSTHSPWVQAEWRLSPDRRVRASAGVYQQFSDFDQALGLSGNLSLAPEHAEQFDAGFEQRFGASTRASVNVYDRDERGMLRRPGKDTRVTGGRLIRGSSLSPYETRLDGFARGVEVLVQRGGANGLSGWISYAYGRNRYHDVVSGETFWGDFDQRHTFNTSAVYRRSERASFVAKLRIGSNFPLPGYYERRDGLYYVTSVRNETRLPAYARLDLRANRTFSWSRRRVTVFAEVINVLNRSNVRFQPPSIDTRTRQATNLFETMLPVIPSAGVLIEF